MKPFLCYLAVVFGLLGLLNVGASCLAPLQPYAPVGVSVPEELPEADDAPVTLDVELANGDRLPVVVQRSQLEDPEELQRVLTLALKAAAVGAGADPMIVEAVVALVAALGGWVAGRRQRKPAVVEAPTNGQ